MEARLNQRCRQPVVVTLPFLLDSLVTWFSPYPMLGEELMRLPG